MSKLTLIIDDRERIIFKHLNTELTEVNYAIKRLEVGDYAILYENKVIASFERKSYNDFACSINDNRHQNKQKMLKLQKDTGCAIYYIIEGPAFQSPNKKFNRKPYWVIEGAIDRLVIRDKFNILYTKDTLNTVQRLARFVKSMETLIKNNELPELLNCTNLITGGPSEPAEAVEGGIEPAGDDIELLCGNVADESICCSSEDIDFHRLISEDDPIAEKEISKEIIEKQIKPDIEIPKELLEKQIKPDIDIVRCIWSAFPGISIAGSDLFIPKFSVKNIVCGAVNMDDLKKVKYSNGRIINVKLRNSLISPPASTCEKLLSKIPGISLNTSREILINRKLSDILVYDIDKISSIIIGKRKCKLGIKKATNIIKYFNYIGN